MAHSTATRRNTRQHRYPHPLRLPQDRPPRAVLDLGVLATAPRWARAWTRQVLREWRLSVLSDTAELIVSELTTNAMLASGPDHPRMRLTLALDHGELAISVQDHCPSAPEPGNAADDDEHGRGLLLVEAMSSRSGWYSSEDGTPGKVVWAALSS